jgi:hypothetical protein
MADYGPVSLQFVFKLAALVLLVRFHQNANRRDLAWAFFLFGLGMWDKAIFAWVLFGLAIAAVAVFPRELRNYLTRANIAVAGLAMLAGALPLVIYNIARPLETLRSNAHMGQMELPHKAEILKQTMDGYVLFGFLTAIEPGPHPGEPKHWYQSLSLAVSRWTGRPRRNAIMWAAIASVLSLAFLWKWLWNSQARRPVLFGLIVCAATWLPMVLTAGAGGAAHHAILLWPFQLLPIAAVLVEHSRDQSVLRRSNRQRPYCPVDRCDGPSTALFDGSSPRADRRRRLGLHGNHEFAERRRITDGLRRYQKRPGYRRPAGGSFEPVRRAHGGIGIPSAGARRFGGSGQARELSGRTTHHDSRSQWEADV